MQHYTVYFIWKHAEQSPDKINCVTLHLVGYILEYYYDAQTNKR